MYSNDKMSVPEPNKAHNERYVTVVNQNLVDQSKLVRSDNHLLEMCSNLLLPSIIVIGGPTSSYSI